MDEREVYNEFDLRIKHYKGDQTVEEIHKPCDACLFKKNERCLIFTAPTNQSIRSCISNYRVDIETLLSAMQEKRKIDNDTWFNWVKSVMVKKPDDVIDIIGVHKELEKALGE
jgi:hypothetical protein